ncbi:MULTISPECIES: SCO family protein [unclassified Spirosoma]|uniref:SCO family protein n=1 Tax=unclassified Spirosoma TaxID=2621999 RepID=UPI000964C3D1|nr:MULTISPECIES: SCO family protein [unclassified Spirosoma]MBN8822868.1 SCO family protein [Spirosoma sp.]OJW80061.1 MAG: SCO family protein [Spirosoma sp. 48-14]
MSTNQKAGILLATLLVPALLYLFLRFGTQNHYVLPRYLPKIDSTKGEPLMGKVTLPDGSVMTDTVYNHIPPFQLIDQDGKTVDQSIVKGKIYVADFFFTRCGTICPRISSQLTRVQDIFRENPSIVFLSHTVDPEHDRPAQLKAYAQKYEAIPGKWYFLTGDKAKIYDLAMHGYYLPTVDAGVKEGKPDETFIHSEKLVLVDKEGIVRGFYDGTNKEDVDRLILEIRVLLDIYNKD